MIGAWRPLGASGRGICDPLLLPFAFAAFAATTADISHGAAENDIVILAQSWWGTPIEEFPAKAGLTSDQYGVHDDPYPMDWKVAKELMPYRAYRRWEPAELSPQFFEFPESLDRWQRGREKKR